MATAARYTTIPAVTWDEQIAELLREIPRLGDAAREAVCDVLKSLLAEGAIDLQEALPLLVLLSDEWGRFELALSA